MIGKQVKGRGFRGLLNYLFDKEGAQLIGGNMVGENPRELAAEFRFLKALNPRVERVVYHASLSVPAREKLDNEKWIAIAQDYLNGMGFNDNQYVIVRHVDRSHDHIHIVASRIKLTGECVHDGWDYRRSEQLIRQLERDYQLEAAHSSWEKDRRSPTTGEWRQRQRTGEDSVREKLQNYIDEAATDCPTMPQLINRLKNEGIDVRVGYTHTGNHGISYQLDGIAISGTHLGREYTFPGLQKYKGVNYCSGHDRAIQRGSDRLPADVEEVQLKRTRIVAQIVSNYLHHIGENEHQSKQYTAGWDEDELVLVRNSDSRQLMRAIYKDNSWQAVERGRLTEADIQFFQRWQQLLIEAQETEQLQRERKQEQRGFQLEP
ncbi:relaxase/mobilization nuclease domain-containing protein [Floridanema aerugineum]|uniref:Relaxase/mobilization nuclease domain-containing protein n=1 Tax=Floridaenema aerugineum BLCC-F46 TaxID=3153654 RepID=A0ABV4XCS3_9CYAN